MQFIAWDIETDTSGGFGTDPNNGGIISIAAGRYEATATGLIEIDTFFDQVPAGDDDVEREVLEAFDLWLLLQSTAPLIGWSSTFFDAPFCHRRAEMVGAQLGLDLTFDPELKREPPPLPGFDGGYNHVWHGHASRDLQHSDFDSAWCAEHGTRRGLKAVSRHFGGEPIEVDRALMHLMTDEDLRAYNMSDVEMTARLYGLALSQARCSGPEVAAV